MIINSRIPDNNNVSFGKANITICTFSDLHGNVNELTHIYVSIKRQINDIFIKRNAKSTLNAMAIVGDYFCNPSLKGFISDKNKTMGDFQLAILKSFLNNLKKMIPGIKTYFTIGNHELDAGDKFLFNLLKRSKMKTIATNVDFNSKEITALSKHKRNSIIAKSEILTVTDNKNKKLKDNVLLLGLTPQGLDYYYPKSDNIPGLADNFKVIDRFNHLEAKAKESELTETFNILIKEIKDFRNKVKNPDAPVVIMSHTGDAVSNFIAKKLTEENAPVNFILSGHDHLTKDYTVDGTNTKIISLSKDGKLFKSLQMHFSDEGKLEYSNISTIIPNKKAELKYNSVKRAYDNNLGKDNKPILKIIPNNTILSQEDIRKGNNFLANTITDTILKEINEKDPSVSALCVSSSSFRRSLSNYSTNVDILNVLSGAIKSQSIIQTGMLDGKNIAEFILEYISNCINTKKNDYPIIHWAGIRINKTELSKIIKSKNFDTIPLDTKLKKVAEFVKIIDNREYESLNLTKPYKIALPNKFFIRSSIESMKAHKDKFKDLDKKKTTLNDLLIKYLQDNDYKLKVSDDNRIL